MAGSRTSPVEGPLDASRGPGASSEAGRASGSIEQAVRRVFAPEIAVDEPRWLRLWDRWRGTLRLLRPLGHVSLGNRVEVFRSGDDAYERMWEAIEAAVREVSMTTYIFEPDAVGLRMLAALRAAAERGCDVTLVIDAFGSHRLEEEHLAPLRRAGATIIEYNPVLRWSTPVSRLVRNHQKILVCDREVGFAGGMNVAEDYAGARFGNGRVRDTHLELRGPCVEDLARIVEEIRQQSALPLEPERAEGDGCLAQILESNLRRHRRAIQLALRTTVRRSVERCYLTTPYFVPPWRLRRTLEQAAKRGVDVRVLTAGLSDVPLVRMASQHLYGRLLRAGVKLYELESPTLHAKTTTIDGVYASVGSFNLDYWSYRRNLEVSVCFLDRGIAAAIEADFERDLENARQVDLEAWRHRTIGQRILHWCAYQLMRL